MQLAKFPHSLATMEVEEGKYLVGKPKRAKKKEKEKQ